VAFGVADVDAAHDELVAQGFESEFGPADYDWGRAAYLRDPDGHLIELAPAEPDAG
jgi:catechol 2,3-dioxygenase-like lactoylglutathione lyase family enzyme